MPAVTVPATPPKSTARFLPLLPGLALAAALAAAAVPIPHLLGMKALSPLIVAMVMGIAIRNTIGFIPAAHPGIAFSLKRVLRFAIILLGFQLTLTELDQIGLSGIAVIVATLSATFLFTKLMGRLLGVDRQLAELIAAGTSVCGASAVIACNTVTRGSDEDVAYAVACVTIFGTLSMILMPMLAAPLGLASQSYGIWVGASVHEVAQAVGAGFALDSHAGQIGAVAKLGRVILLAPLILSLGALAARRVDEASTARPPMPWFVFGFIAVMLFNSVVKVPEAVSHQIVMVTSFLLAMALAAMGLETDVRKLRLKGLRPLALGAVAWLFIVGLALVLVKLLVA